MLVIQRCLSSSTCTLQPRSTAWTFRQKSLNDSTSRHRAASHEGRPQSVRLPNLKLSGGRQYSLVSNNRLLQRLECSASADSNYDAAYETGPTIVRESSTLHHNFDLHPTMPQPLHDKAGCEHSSTPKLNPYSTAWSTKAIWSEPNDI